MGERRLSSLEGRSQIDVPGDDPSVEEAVHSVLDVVLSDGRRISEGIVSEVLGQDALRVENLVGSNLADAQVVQLDVGDATLSAPVLERVGLRQIVLVT